MRIAVLGAGMVGRAIAIDLAKDHAVTSFDISEHSLNILNKKNNAVKTVKADLTDFDNYIFLLNDFDIVVTAVPGFMGYQTLEAVIKAKKNVVDISFFPEDALQLDELAKKNNVTAIVDCGVAPGMSNLILGYYNAQMNVMSFECMVGGLPKKRIPPFEYKAPFSPVDVIQEYIRPARLMEHGNIVTKPALSDAAIIDFERPGPLECFNTDGLRSLLFTMSHIPDMKEQTLRYPGHIDLIKKMIAAGFFDEQQITINDCSISPLEFSSALLTKQWKLGETEEEFTLMQVKITGQKNNKKETVIYDLFDEYDVATETSSMARTTGYTCTAAVNLLINKLFTAAGIFPPELIGSNTACFNFILNYLAERKVIYRKRVHGS
ncbi:MAG: saccharopine dehydrogenase C-terminal domain-containing protein [Ferruginibacter sp.]